MPPGSGFRVIVTCEACDTRFQLDDERVPADGVRVRCSCCHHGFFVSAKAGDDAESAANRSAGPLDEEGLALSDHFDRAVEEDRAEVLAREKPSPLPEASEAGLDSPRFDSDEPAAPVLAVESRDSGTDEVPSLSPSEPMPAPRPPVLDRDARASFSKQAVKPRDAGSSPWRVPRPPRLGQTVTAVGWTLTLGLCVLGLLWEIGATLRG